MNIRIFIYYFLVMCHASYAGTIEKVSIDRKKAVLEVSDDEYQNFKTGTELFLYVKDRKQPIQVKVIEKAHGKITVLFPSDAGRLESGENFELNPPPDEKSANTTRKREFKVLKVNEWGDKIVVVPYPQDSDLYSVGSRIYLKSKDEVISGVVARVKEERIYVDLDRPIKSVRKNQTIAAAFRTAPFHPSITSMPADKYLSTGLVGIEYDYGNGTGEVASKDKKNSDQNLRFSSIFKFGKDNESFFVLGINRNANSEIGSEGESKTSTSRLDWYFQFGSSLESYSSWIWGVDFRSMNTRTEVKTGDGSATGDADAFLYTISLIRRWLSGHAGLAYTPSVAVKAKSGSFKSDSVAGISIWQRAENVHFISHSEYDTPGEKSIYRERAKFRSRVAIQYWLGYWHNFELNYFYNYRNFSYNADEINNMRVAIAYTFTQDNYAVTLSPSYTMASGKLNNEEVKDNLTEITVGIYYLSPPDLGSKAPGVW